MIEEWSGWKLDGRRLEAPRRMMLSPQESRILSVLIAARGKPVVVEDVAARAGISSKDSTVRSIVNALRAAVGKDAIASRRFVGYWLRSVRPGRGPSTDALDDVVKLLTDALAAAKALRKTRN